MMTVPDFAQIPDVPLPDADVAPADAAGMVVFEAGQVWLLKPKDGYGGYRWTFPKGRRDPGGLTHQQTAHRELWEETGLAAQITGYLGDYEGDVTLTRFYRGTRTGGAPLPRDLSAYRSGGRETEEVALLSVRQAFVLLNRTRDRRVLAAALTS